MPLADANVHPPDAKKPKPFVVHLQRRDGTASQYRFTSLASAQEFVLMTYTDAELKHVVGAWVEGWEKRCRSCC